MARACKRDFRGYIVPGPTSYPGLGGLGRVQVSALSFGSLLHPGAYLGLHPTLGKKIKANFSEDLFFALQQILGKKLEKKFAQVWCWVIDLCVGGPNKIWEPGIDLRTLWKNFSLRPCLWLGYVPQL